MSRIVLSEETLNSIIEIALINSPIKSFKVNGTMNDTLYVNIKEVYLDNWFLNKIANNTKMEIKLSVKDNILNVSVDLYGAMLSFFQNLPHLDNILLVYCPKLKDINGFKIISLSEIEIDLNVFLKNIKVNSINVYANALTTMYIDFSIK